MPINLSTEASKRFLYYKKVKQFLRRKNFENSEDLSKLVMRIAGEFVPDQLMIHCHNGQNIRHFKGLLSIKQK